MDQFVKEYIKLVIRMWNDVLVIPLSPDIIDFGGVRCVDPNGLGLPFDEINKSHESGLTTRSPVLVATLCRRGDTQFHRVYEIVSWEHPVILDLRREFIYRSLGDEYTNIISQMQRDSNYDSAEIGVRGSDSFYESSP